MQRLSFSRSLFRSRYERTSAFFDPLVTAPYAVFGIQMITLFYSGLVCSNFIYTFTVIVS